MISVFFVSSVSRGHTMCCPVLPQPRLSLFTYTFWNKKTWESVLRAYPYSQALALPLCEDKQRRSLPTSVNIYVHATTQHNP